MLSPAEGFAYPRSESQEAIHSRRDCGSLPSAMLPEREWRPPVVVVADALIDPPPNDDASGAK